MHVRVPEIRLKSSHGFDSTGRGRCDVFLDFVDAPEDARGLYDIKRGSERIDKSLFFCLKKAYVKYMYWNLYIYFYV